MESVSVSLSVSVAGSLQTSRQMGRAPFQEPKRCASKVQIRQRDGS